MELVENEGMRTMFLSRRWRRTLLRGDSACRLDLGFRRTGKGAMLASGYDGPEQRSGSSDLPG